MSLFSGIGDALKGVVKIGAPILGTALGGPLGGALGGALGSAVGGGSVLGGAAAGGLGGLAGKIPGLGSAAQFLGGNGGMNALGLAQGVNAAYMGKKSGDMADAALKSVQGAYDANAPLRAQGRQQMLSPGQGIQARIAAIPQGNNVYAHPQTPTLGPAAPGTGAPNAWMRHSTGGPV